MHCNNCDEEINDLNVHWSYEDPYCEECFEELYNYCSRCDEVILRESILYDECGDPFCRDCFEENFDEDCPENPPVANADRKLIVHLSRNWLKDNVNYKKLIYINNKDFHLKTIRYKVGLVNQPIYLFGLKDEDDYQISASQDLFQEVQKFLQLNSISVKTAQGIGCNRLGISLTLRKNNQHQVVELIKKITTINEPVSV